LDELSLHRDGIIVGNGSLKASAQHIFHLQTVRKSSPGSMLIFRLDAETAAVGRDEVLVYLSGGFPDACNAVEAQFGRQSILKAAIDSFGSASGLRGVGKDQPDAQLIHGPLEPGGFVIALGNMEATVAGRGELGGAVQIKAYGKAIVLKDFLADGKTAGQVLFFPEKPVQRLARGIIRAQDQTRGLRAK